MASYMGAGYLLPTIKGLIMEVEELIADETPTGTLQVCRPLAKHILQHVKIR
jgi:hypothetical protein